MSNKKTACNTNYEKSIAVTQLVKGMREFGHVRIWIFNVAKKNPNYIDYM